MNKTTIYSCGSDVTSGGLAGYMCRQLGIKTMRTIWFPEVRHNGRWSFPPVIPYHESELPGVALSLIGRRIVTVSEIIILTLLREVRMGRMRTDEIDLFCVHTDIDDRSIVGHRNVGVDIKGQLITPWGGEGFFEEGFNMVFN